MLRHQAEQAGRTVPIISDESLQRMKDYRWPGNLRELRTVIGSALAVSSGSVLEIGEHLLNNGVRVGSYSLIERIGSGGMGEVWLARHQLLARPAAVASRCGTSACLPWHLQAGLGAGSDVMLLPSRRPEHVESGADRRLSGTVAEDGERHRQALDGHSALRQVLELAGLGQRPRQEDIAGKSFAN